MVMTYAVMPAAKAKANTALAASPATDLRKSLVLTNP